MRLAPVLLKASFVLEGPVTASAPPVTFIHMVVEVVGVVKVGVAALAIGMTR